LNFVQKQRKNNCFKNGIQYEKKIIDLLKPLYHIIGTGGSTRQPDIQVQTNDSTIVRIEIKNKNAFEGGGKVMKLINGKLKCPSDSLHHEILYDYIPWNGRIPSFMFGDCSLSTWQKEKHLFPDIRIQTSPDVIRKYYQQQ
jgi:hypothetical protein